MSLAIYTLCVIALSYAYWKYRKRKYRYLRLEPRTSLPVNQVAIRTSIGDGYLVDFSRVGLGALLREPVISSEKFHIQFDSEHGLRRRLEELGITSVCGEIRWADMEDGGPTRVGIRLLLGPRQERLLFALLRNEVA